MEVVVGISAWFVIGAAGTIVHKRFSKESLKDYKAVIGGTFLGFFMPFIVLATWLSDEYS